mmetsp:Transcript_3841/g.5598  ORF Transcript_3841/g.5598 Transcript_3841/m.5598 type:complete len:236 (-) Transcript_3841:89-796(-)|eukprot:CAMPEP_0201686444 /NCGR_PEP_ID=MMETSP0578-20130828/890_1 /ASSEMBLY_ACC=CAM_ASM_000663 /TAXON_ID=267565 /ORGANISM="Skeletonema grethea, Strain CCMP 1804" /LENGTH=235 /DNA_ID=CAMNT_0048170503 /DNA_START=108 /DNA_END=815 /DNA_ORIENTATION=-
MKIATVTTILATSILATSEGKKSKTSNDYYNSKDGDRFAARWGHDDDWRGDDHDDDEWYRGSWKYSKSAKSSGKSGKSGSSAFHCYSKTYYIDLDDLLDDEERNQNGITDHYADYRVYTKSSEVGDAAYDGVFAYSKQFAGEFSCQGTGMLGLDEERPPFDDMIYFNTICNPDEDDPTENGFVTGGGITGGYGKYASATGTVEYDTSGSTGELKFWICLPNGTEKRWGSSWEKSD